LPPSAGSEPEKTPLVPSSLLDPNTNFGREYLRRKARKEQSS
jgi:hypothetical protein